MSTKTALIFFPLVVAMLALVLISRHSVNRLEEALLRDAEKERVFESYTLSSFNASALQDKVLVSELCQSYLNDSSLVAYLPSGLCRACFSSLVFSLHDHEFPEDRITIISEQEDFEVKKECFSRGIHYMVEKLPVGSIPDIMVFRLYRGFLPIAIEYNLNREPLLPLFLSDDERLLRILTHAD